MSVRTMSAVWAGSRHGGTELLMLLAIADFADDDGNAYPSVAKLAEKCRMKPRNANYILKALQDSQELEVRLGAGPAGKNRYRINLRLLGLQHGAGVQSSAGVQRDAGVQSLAGLQHSAAPPATQCANPLQPIAAKPSMNRQEPSGALPDWVPVENWKAWVELRKKIRRPLTDKAKELAVKKLGDLREQGHDPAQVLDQSVLNGWQGLFAVKADVQRPAIGAGHGQPSANLLGADEQIRSTSAPAKSRRAGQ